MNFLFVHQGFPGQYGHILEHLCRHTHHTIIGLGIHSPTRPFPEAVQYLRYRLNRVNAAGIHPWAVETESKLIRAEACAKAAFELKEQGFKPDLICAHPGWGESLFLHAVWPDVPLLCYQEFFYQTEGFDLNFDPELQGHLGWHDKARTQMKNAYLLMTLESATWNVSATAFQRSSFPQHWQQRISVIHDGIDTNRAQPNPGAAPLLLPDSTELQQGQPIVTFVNRRFEPYRGCHTFLRAIPALQQLAPEARIVIVGATEGVSYGAECPEGEWKEAFLQDIEGRYDASRVHFTGPLPYEAFLQLLQLSACHVYLTYPFVLSWSLLEAMSSGCAVVGSATAPVQEVIRDGENGLLVDFFKPDDLAIAVAELLHNCERAAALGQKARDTILRHYRLEQCVPRHLALMELVASGAIGR
ncbi:glycosyltransferase family 4 protein [Synechococcus sp. CS-1328]|uniref:glycosyltransferase family 4 protein n=1 Tax=Synechococcus sp. CS-1328 TaxID=2847976 RepID=UPI00223B91CF|nr:glycosyltransferase family 4 protein [Synechococcus sp. CS-1328]MCT0224980.1 glycosyltransferase family 4 protein [Synechococcus sp. CS-1328]